MAGIFAGAAYVIIPLYLSEISNNNIRGCLTSSMVLAANFGFLLSFILGTYVSIFAISIFIIVLAVLFELSLLLLPESPTFLIKQRNFASAENSIRFYKNLRKTAQHQFLLELEINKIQAAIADNQIQNRNKTAVKWSDFTTKTSVKAFLLGVILIILFTYNGNITLSNYTKQIFKETGSNLTTDVSSVVIAAIQLIGVFAG